MQTLLTIGNFDGVHRGHQKLIECLLHLKAQIQGDSKLVALTFEPHPIEVLRPGIEVERLTPPSLKEKFLKQYGVDEVVILDFDSHLATMSPEDFFKKIVLHKLACDQIAVGENFKFGVNQSGDVETLKKLGDQYGVRVHVIAKFTDHNLGISSSRIRKTLFSGDVKGAAELLGRPYRLMGSVVHGAQRGSSINVPTANLKVTSSCRKCAIPHTGVYVTKSFIEDSEEGLPSVTNIGVRPTVDQNSTVVSIETHVLTEVGDLYGKMMSVEFLDRIRDEKRFNSLDELKHQIQADIQFAKSYLR